MISQREQLVEALVARLGEGAVVRGADAIQRSLRDNSWLSPVLLEHFQHLRGAAGESLAVDAAVFPADVAALRDTLALAARHRAPIVLRGAGTSNFGQTVPLQGGLIIDVRRLNRILDVAPDRITVEAGTLQIDVENAARAHGKELTVLTTTYASATAAGWIAGGHVGIGAPLYGTIWDGNVLAVKLLSAEDPPRELTLQGTALEAVLHTYGTTGAITEVTFPLVPARQWVEAVAVFDTFDAAARFTQALTAGGTVPHRIASAVEPAMAQTLTPLTALYRADQSAVLLILDAAREDACRALVARASGTYHFWRQPDDARRCPLAYLVYGHRMLWIKKQAPPAAFLHGYGTPGRELEQLHAIKQRFGADVWLELKYMRSGWFRRLRGLPPDGVLPSLFITMVPGDRAFMEAVMAHCDALGVGYQNPHTFVLEEAGVFLDFGRVVAFKQQVDPHGLMNPGKIGTRFFARGTEARDGSQTAG